MRREKIQRRREELMMKKQEETRKKERKIIMRKEALTKSVAGVGLWLTQEQVEQGLQKLSTKKEKVQILKLQINFRHYVLAQSHSDSTIFKFSCNRKPFSVDRLKENLLKLLGDIPRSDRDNEPATYETNDDTSLDMDNNTDELDLDHTHPDNMCISTSAHDGRLNGNTSAKEAAPTSSLVQPKALVGKKVRHRFDVNGELEWYDGKVLCMNNDTLEFETEYDGEKDTFWFSLLDDLSAGDLIIL